MVNIPSSLNKFLAAEPPATALPDISILGIQGPDALAFAQSQFMNDVETLGVMQWQWNGWLNTKGRVIALFLLLRVAPDSLLLVLPDMPAAVLGPRLVGYVLRNKLQMGVWSELHVSGSFDSPGLAEDVIGGSWDERRLTLSLPAAGVPRSLHITGTPGQSQPQSIAAWKMLSLFAGIPALDNSQVEKWTPQQLSLQRFNAFSVKKGCYPGQEIVARTHFLGKNKRELVLLDPQHIATADAASIVSSAQFDGDTAALAVIAAP